MTRLEARKVAYLKRMKPLRIAVLMNYNGLHSPGSPGREQWCYEDGGIVLSSHLAKGKVNT